jgi:hypothetical protein
MSAMALSCRAYADRFFVACTEGECRPVMRVRDVHAFGRLCARRTQLEAIPAQLLPALLPLAPRAGYNNGTYAIVFDHADPRGPESADSPDALSGWSPPSIEPLELALSEVRKSFELQAQEELWSERKRMAVELLLSLFVLFVLVATTAKFARGFCRGGKPGWSRLPLAIQSGLVLIGMVWAFASMSAAGGFALLLSVPAGLFVLGVEVSALGVRRIRPPKRS